MLTEETLIPSKVTSAVLLLHGLGDSGEGLMDLASTWAPAMPETAFHAPNAPFDCDVAPFGYQWFSIRDQSMEALYRGIAEAAPLLNAYIDAVQKQHNLAAANIALVGFSQGTMMSLYVAPRRKEMLAGVVGYSGALIAPERLPKERQSAPPFLLVHGTHDEMVPFEALASAKEGLEDANINVSVVECPGLGHSIDAKGLKEGENFLRKVLKIA